METTAGKAPSPSWSLCDEEWLHIGDEVAILSDLTEHHRDAYGRIIGSDPESGHPVVLVLCPGLQARETVMPLGDILGKRVRVPASEDALRAGGGREDRIWSASLTDDRRGREWL